MVMATTYAGAEPARAEIDAVKGPLLLEFGTDWCGFCQAAQPLIREAFAGHDEVPHQKVEDGKGCPLGRSFGVKLWPTLVFMRDGVEVAKLVRPDNIEQIQQALARIQATA
jgi:thioredoxin 1